MEGGGEAHEGTAVTSSSSLHPSSSKRKATVDLEDKEEDDDLQQQPDAEDSHSRLPPPKDSSYMDPSEYSEDGVNPAFMIPGSKHCDGSIYKTDAHYWHELYHLDDTNETRLEPMTPSYSEQDCRPCTTDCQWHMGDSMMQIFSLKLAEISDFATRAAAAADGTAAIQLYGFMAVRDLLDPWRNYVFNHTRDDPFTISDDGLPRDDRVRVYDMRIKRGQNEQDDLVLIDGAATFSKITNFIPYTFRIHGDCDMAVDIRLAHFCSAVEATKQVRIYELKDGCGSLNLTITCHVSYMPPQIKLFQGPIDKLRDLNRFVVAAELNTLMITELKLVHQHGLLSQRFESRVVPHGSMFHCAKFVDLAIIGVEIIWSILPLQPLF